MSNGDSISTLPAVVPAAESQGRDATVGNRRCAGIERLLFQANAGDPHQRRTIVSRVPDVGPAHRALEIEGGRGEIPNGNQILGISVDVPAKRLVELSLGSVGQGNKIVGKLGLDARIRALPRS